MNFVWNYGGDILNADYTAPGTDTDAWKQGIQDYMTFYEEGLTPPGSEAMSLEDTLTMFQNGEIAMMVATSDYCKLLQTCEPTDGYDPANLGVGIMPHEEYQTAYGGADVLVIPTAAQHPEEAARLINFLLRSDNQLEYAMAVGFFPRSRVLPRTSITLPTRPAWLSWMQSTTAASTLRPAIPAALRKSCAPQSRNSLPVTLLSISTLTA